jgi:Cft2 family RNA processing exonuclease
MFTGSSAFAGDDASVMSSMSARLIAVSGLGPKEPAAFVVEAEGRRLLLDCGAGPEPGRLPDFDAIGRIDAVLLSHGHNDHAGALRFRDRIGTPPVYATAPAITRLPDGIAAHSIPIRGRAQVLGIGIQTGPDGHAPGGVWLRLEVGEGLIYMGDHCVESALYRFAPPPATATMIFDASYGDAEATQEAQRSALAEMAAEGPLLLPVPADGRGPEIATFMQEAGFDVAVDDAVCAVATLLTRAARESAKPAGVPALQRLIGEARGLDAEAPASGVMVAHGGSGDVGVAAALIRRWGGERDPAIVFTGHLPAGTAGRKLVDSGRALFRRWNVHPTFSQNVQLIESVDPRRVVPAFGDSRCYPVWRERLAPREVITSKVTEL